MICIGISPVACRGIYTAHHQKVPSAVMRYRVCYGSYMSEYYYWELVVLARKVSFQLPALYLSTSNDDPMRSILYGIVIVVISIILQALARPFRSSLLNRVELLGLIVVFFSLASCGLTITTKRHRYLTRSDTSLSGVQAFYFVMFVVVNLAYIVYVLRTISRNWNADVKKRGSKVHTKGGHKKKVTGMKRINAKKDSVQRQDTSPEHKLPRRTYFGGRRRGTTTSSTGSNSDDGSRYHRHRTSTRSFDQSGTSDDDVVLRLLLEKGSRFTRRISALIFSTNPSNSKEPRERCASSVACTTHQMKMTAAMRTRRCTM